jgi:hypothetical protein
VIASSAAIPAVADDAIMTQRHSARPASKCGAAEPMVSAPTSTPMARPRPCLNQVAISFIPVGYTPANMTPVPIRRPISKPRPTVVRPSSSVMSRGIARFKAAPTSAQPAMSRGGWTRSERLNTALPSAPITKPSCTLIVSHA